MLKGDRDFHLEIDPSYFWSTAQTTAERGGVACITTAGSGVSLDDEANTVSYVADPSGALPVGVMLGDIVNVDLTKAHEDFLKEETVAGRKVPVATHGWLVTDLVNGTPAAGDTAYLAASGYISDTQAGGAPSVGKFVATKDADGFIKVRVLL